MSLLVLALFGLAPNTATSGNLSKNSFEAVVTAYVATCKGCSGITRDGTKADYRKNIIAVDPRVIPLGSTVEITFKGGTKKVYTARDTGGKIKGARIDILVSDTQRAKTFGKQILKARILKWGK